MPWALLILVIYFLIKCWVEWAQCHPERRKVLFARIDFYLAGFVSLAAIGLYFFQAASRNQLADILQRSNRLPAATFGALGGASLAISATVILIRKQTKKKPPSPMVAMAIGFPFIGLTSIGYGAYSNIPSALLGAMIGLGAVGLLLWWMWRNSPMRKDLHERGVESTFAQ